MSWIFPAHLNVSNLCGSPWWLWCISKIFQLYHLRYQDFKIQELQISSAHLTSILILFWFPSPSPLPRCWFGFSQGDLGPTSNQAMRANSILGASAPSSEPMCAVPSWALSNATGILMDHQCHFLKKKSSWLGGFFVLFFLKLAAKGCQEPQVFLFVSKPSHYPSNWLWTCKS